MGETADVRGYYAALGLAPGASIIAVKGAYRRLAKECHPDRIHVRDGGKRFREISEAYETLSDAQRKAAYDSAIVNARSDAQATTEGPDPQVIEPVTCDDCGKITALPRRLAFWRITGFLFGSHKGPVQKVYCRSCASKEEWKSTIWTSLLGWWGIPWGPIWSTGHGVSNALGGSRDANVDDALMWRNALAFASSGQGSLAVGLGNILRKSENAQLAQQAADLIKFFSDRGVDTSTTLKDVWDRSVGRTAALLLVLFAIPTGGLAFAVSSSLEPRATTTTSDPFADLIPAKSQEPPASSSDRASTEVVATGPNETENLAAEQPPVPACSNPPANGDLISDAREPVERGHVLQIENGTEGDAIVKIRDAATDRTVASFFVASGQSGSLRRIPDGTYRVQYAFGDKLGSDCRSFIQVASAGEFPGSETLKTEYQQLLDGTRIVTGRLSYTLYTVPGGNVDPQTIAAADFNKP